MPSDDLRDQADDYADHDIDLPIDHPFNALKAHCVVFGVSLGALLGILGATWSTPIATTMALALLVYAYGLEPGVISSADGRVAIATKQIRRKPHYFGGPLVVAFVAVLGVA